LAGYAEENHRKMPSGWPVCGLVIAAGTSQAESSSSTHMKYLCVVISLSTPINIKSHF
jgi:hypothetical protein